MCLVFRILHDYKKFFIFFCIVFFATIAVGFALQFYILPVWFENHHAGHGLLVGGDWIYFHQLAVDMALNIQTFGWSEWELRPNGQAPSGVAAAIYALTGVYEPWVVLPLNAFLFSASALCLYCLLLIRPHKD